MNLRSDISVIASGSLLGSSTK